MAVHARHTAAPPREGGPLPLPGGGRGRAEQGVRERVRALRNRRMAPRKAQGASWSSIGWVTAGHLVVPLLYYTVQCLEHRTVFVFAHIHTPSYHCGHSFPSPTPLYTPHAHPPPPPHTRTSYRDGEMCRPYLNSLTVWRADTRCVRGAAAANCSSNSSSSSSLVPRSSAARWRPHRLLWSLPLSLRTTCRRFRGRPSSPRLGAPYVQPTNRGELEGEGGERKWEGGRWSPGQQPARQEYWPCASRAQGGG